MGRGAGKGNLISDSGGSWRHGRGSHTSFCGQRGEWEGGARDHYASEIRMDPEEKTGNCPHQSKIKAFFLTINAGFIASGWAWHCGPIGHALHLHSLV